MVVTNCADGKAEYLSEYRNQKRLSAIGKASSSMPLFTKIVSLDGKEYLDGGIADSIPVRRAVELGYKKNVVILTRQSGRYPEMTTYQKLLYDVVYRKYPQLLESLSGRKAVYREELRCLEQMEAVGEAFIIRPSVPEVRRLETDYDVLMNYYEHGYYTARDNWEKLSLFLA